MKNLLKKIKIFKKNISKNINKSYRTHQKIEKMKQTNFEKYHRFYLAKL